MSGGIHEIAETVLPVYGNDDSGCRSFGIHHGFQNNAVLTQGLDCVYSIFVYCIHKYK